MSQDGGTPSGQIKSDASSSAAAAPGITETGRHALEGRGSGRSILPSNTTPSGDFVMPAGRMEANTALIKIGQEAMGELPANRSGLEESPIPQDLEDEGSEAESARIAQEYRRQLRIKRLAVEIQQTEREKKNEELRRKKEREDELRKTDTVRNKESTAKMASVPNPAPVDNETLAKKREAAMSAFKNATGAAPKYNALRVAGLVTVLLICVLSAMAYKLWVLKAESKDKLKQTLASRPSEELSALADEQLAEKLKAANLALEQQKVLAEENARKAEEAIQAKRKLEEDIRNRELAEKNAQEERAKLLAEQKRLREVEQAIEEEKRKQAAEMRKKVEDAARLAREKIKKEQEETADPLKNGLRTEPAESASIVEKGDLPKGGVRLFVKASDPYGGELTFHWMQVKGPKVEIIDPNASKFKDGKWYSQTYFVARQPGSYEFECSVKNDEGVESKKVSKIDVLPVATLK